VLPLIRSLIFFGQPLPKDGVYSRFIQYPTTINNGELRSLLTDGRLQVRIVLNKKLSDYNARVSPVQSRASRRSGSYSPSGSR
jgi:hypothetical protein